MNLNSITRDDFYLKLEEAWQQEWNKIPQGNREDYIRSGMEGILNGMFRIGFVRGLEQASVTLCNISKKI